MSFSRRIATSAAVLVSAGLLACTAAPPEGPQDGRIVPDGKADDFLSVSASEYVVRGSTTVTLEEEFLDQGDDARQARLRELVGYKQVLVSWFLTQYFIDKKPDDENEGYGGFSGMAKANRFEELDLTQVDELTYSFRIHQLIAGPNDLIQRLPTTTNQDGDREFGLTVGTPDNATMAVLETNHEWYRSAPYSAWNPSEVDDSQKTDLTLTIEPERQSDDAWFDYNALFADGLLTIDIHFGWDYHNDYHLRHAEAVFGWLTRQGFEAPVDSFDDLTRESGAFTKELNANGESVLVEARIFFGAPDTETDPDTDEGGRVLEDDVRTSLREADVIVYSGHSGPFYGFAMGNWKMTDEGDFDDSEMATAEMPEETYQVVFAEGCDTYHIGEAFRRNPAKPDGQYIDIITTTAPSNASNPYAVQDLITRLTETDDSGAHQPTTLRSLVTDLDDNSRFMRTMYGIHGIDDNPQLHPYAALENVCQSCDVDSDCGGVGNLCVSGAGDERFCAPACTTDAGCGNGYVCRDIASESSREIYASACTPIDASCR